MDRFIPNRTTSKMQVLFSKLHDEVAAEDIQCKKRMEDPNTDGINSLVRTYLQSEILGLAQENVVSPTRFVNRNLFSFGQQQDSENSVVALFSTRFDRTAIAVSREGPSQRKIPRVPFKVLDAPALQDDFYLNLLDWSDSNLLSVGLGTSVYLWRASNGKVSKVCDLGPDDMVTSVHWAKKTPLLGVGTNSGQVHIWDVNKQEKVRTFKGHSARVGALAWGQTSLVSGSRDKTILVRDIRSHEHFHEQLSNHKQEVCGLKWSFDDQLFCSGGNDNKLFIWTPKSRLPVFKSSAHKAAVKALAWSPHQHGLLASGGGTADRCIRFWNCHTNKMVGCVDTGSQVCNLLFSKNMPELVSTHGYTENQVHVWSYPKMKKAATLTGHTFRVLYLAMSPDGKTIVTGAGDETLRFWDLYPRSEESRSEDSDDPYSISKISIR